MHLVLFGTAGCHLCEQAEGMIRQCLADSPNTVTVDIIDIAEDTHWHELYAVRIPVLYHPETGRELAWPFDQTRVDEFIAFT